MAVLVLTSNHGTAGPYTSSIICETESLPSRLDAADKQPELLVYGRHGSMYYKCRSRDTATTWEGDTDQPGVEIAETTSSTLMGTYIKPIREGGVSELYIIYTEFINMMVQEVCMLHTLLVEVVKNETKVPNPDEEAPATADVASLYTLEPSLEKVLDAILPKYTQSRIHERLLIMVASETVSRQNAMHTATSNARNLIDDPTHKLNTSRQTSITQELIETVGSVDALTKEER